MIQRAEDRVDEVRIGKVQGGHVDADRDRVPAVVQAPDHGDRIAQDPLGEPSDEDTGGLEVAHELPRRDRPVLRVVPPRQRLEAHDRFGAGVDERLVVHVHLVAVDGPFQRLDVVTVAAVGVGEQVGQSTALAGVHGGVGGACQLPEARPPRSTGGHTDGTGHLQRHAIGGVDLDRVDEDLRRNLGHLDGGLGGGIDEDDRELVAAEACDQGSGRHSVPQSTRDLDDDLVACVVAPCVVDDLEPVEVHQEDDDAAARAGGPVQPRFGLLLQCAAVQESGQRILGRVPLALGGDPRRGVHDGGQDHGQREQDGIVDADDDEHRAEGEQHAVTGQRGEEVPAQDGDR